MMETVLAVTVGALFAGSLYLMLSTHLVRILLGVAMLSNAVNLLIFTAGRLTLAKAPIIDAVPGAVIDDLANPLPQALVLTAIVISFSIFAFLLVLTFRAYQTLETDDVEQMRIAEPARDTRPPTDY